LFKAIKKSEIANKKIETTERKPFLTMLFLIAKNVNGLYIKRQFNLI
jgi:hypothetical protein